jgi:hypothetical protein
MSKSTIFAIAILIVFQGTMVNMICNHIFNYNMVLSVRCDCELQLLLV